ncbi:MAG: hypothetical protein ACAH83_00795 [Alphaproteobacteria bacterium]
MTQALTLSTDSQRLVAEAADQEQQRAQKSAKRRLWWTLGGAAAAVAISVVFPPAALTGVAVLVASAVGFISGIYALGDVVNDRMLSKSKKESGQEGFADKMKKRAGSLFKVFKRADKISDYSLYTALGLAAVAILVPPAAPVAWSLYSAAIYVLGGSVITRAATREAHKSADTISALTQDLSARDSLNAMITPSNNDNQPPAPGLANAPSPTQGFDKAVNGPAPDAQPPAPVNKLPPPKP